MPAVCLLCCVTLQSASSRALAALQSGHKLRLPQILQTSVQPRAAGYDAPHCVMHAVRRMQDDPFGAPFPLCESDFSGPDSRDSLVRWLAETQFDATLYCPDCQAASPPPPVGATPSQAPQADVVIPPAWQLLEGSAILATHRMFGRRSKDLSIV